MPPPHWGVVILSHLANFPIFQNSFTNFKKLYHRSERPLRGRGAASHRPACPPAAQ